MQKSDYIWIVKYQTFYEWCKEQDQQKYLLELDNFCLIRMYQRYQAFPRSFFETHAIILGVPKNNYQFYYQYLSREQMSKTSTLKTPVLTGFYPSKNLDNSLSTQQSPRERVPSIHNKQKSQLCKKYMENGFCPYGKRCKFAHGLEELKKNDQANCRYKTRPCGGYLHEGFCTFGNRCNFIHPHSVVSVSASRNLDIDFVSIRASSLSQSRLLKLLKNE